MKNLSLSIITKNSQNTLEKTLRSVGHLVDEIVLIDSYSKDNTLGIAQRFGAKIIQHEYKGEGSQRAFALRHTAGEWILVLDDDESVSPELKKEILGVIKTSKKTSGYIIPFQNHFLGKPIRHGGENYAMLRLFRRNYGYVTPDHVHAQYRVNSGNVEKLTGKIYHYSYRSIPHLFWKFTTYALREARLKYKKGEKVSLQKIFFYGPHLFWVRFIKEGGYKDGLFRIPLDFAFAYMEFLTYLFLVLIKLRGAFAASQR